MATRTWSEQRAELLAHVEELRQRAQHYHARATRLDLAATVLLGAIQLADDGLAHGDPEARPAPAMFEPPPQPKRPRGRPRTVQPRSVDPTVDEVTGVRPDCPKCHTNADVRVVDRPPGGTVWRCFRKPPHQPPVVWTTSG